MARGNLFRCLYWRGLQANLVGAAIAFVYLSFVAPPKPEPPHDERLLFLAVVPIYVLAAGLAGYELGKRHFAPIDRWLAEDRPPSAEERAKVLALPSRTAAMSAAGWGVAAGYSAASPPRIIPSRTLPALCSASCSLG